MNQMILVSSWYILCNVSRSQIETDVFEDTNSRLQ
jgi:hypothetical protein